ncbi:hypothetical protein ACFWUZ_34165 [Streptomyces sp. NPDC058646]|uniref:hypothetical protein n=1 Tax=Streptomyces sp. NPDC058646 TaxID=3346574 RepID=UPI0036582115
MYGELWAWTVEQPARAAVAVALVGLPAVGALAQQRQADQKKAGGAPVAGASGGGVLARFLTGRDLRPGEPSSSASWWCAGVEVARDRTAADIGAEDPGAGWETTKTVSYVVRRTRRL